jgi:hypothetical protein
VQDITRARQAWPKKMASWMAPSLKAEPSVASSRVEASPSRLVENRSMGCPPPVECSRNLPSMAGRDKLAMRPAPRSKKRWPSCRPPAFFSPPRKTNGETS